MLPLATVRRLAVAAQGYGARERGNADAVAALVARLSCVQLDSIATVERSDLLVLGSRLGRVRREDVNANLAAGRLVEHWAHEACLLPVEAWPLLRRRMRAGHPWWGDVVARDRALARAILRRIEREGSLPAREFEGAGGGGMWRLKPAKVMLDALWTRGDLVVVARDRGFQKVYDLASRRVPEALRKGPAPSEPAYLRALVLGAVRGRGALTARGAMEHWRLRGGVARIGPAVARLVRDGALALHEVEDGVAPVLVSADADLDPPQPEGAFLLSPFDNLLWDRAFVERVFGFRHVMEIFKREPERKYGYYVMPLLLGDRLVGRADVKAERDAGRLAVRAFHREPGVRAAEARAALAEATERLGRALGLAVTRP